MELLNYPVKASEQFQFIRKKEFSSGLIMS